jgi:uncharacterized protein YihD (DUF1040 family)
MRDTKRIPEILAKLRKVWEEHPDMRLAQLLGNIFDKLPYYMEDDEFIKAIEAYYSDL